MNTTPIESLLSKQSGKFLSDEELFQIQNDLSFLIQENKKLSSLLEKNNNVFQQQSQPVFQQPNPVFQPQQQSQPFLDLVAPESQIPEAQVQSQQSQQTQQSQQSQQTQPISHQYQPVSHQSTHPSKQVITTSNESSEHTIPPDVKSITIIIDTNKLVYLLLFIIIMIIILKK